MNKLSQRIHEFLDKYARISPNWDGNDDGDKYTGPDSYQLKEVAYYIDNGLKPFFPWSEWGSGCYYPYSDREGQREHQEILNEIKLFIHEYKKD